VSRHLLTRPGRSSARAAYLQPALRGGVYDHRLGHDPCHGTSAVPECPRALSVTAGSDGADDFQVGAYAHDPRHAAAAVSWYLYGFDGHGAARVEDKADSARNVNALPVVEVCRTGTGRFFRIERIRPPGGGPARYTLPVRVPHIRPRPSHSRLDPTGSSCSSAFLVI
jgi:hypothetical protein